MAGNGGPWILGRKELSMYTQLCPGRTLLYGSMIQGQPNTGFLRTHLVNESLTEMGTVACF